MREPILSTEDITRVRAKYPDKVKRPRLLKPVLSREPVKKVRRPEDYKSLRHASRDPRLPTLKTHFDGSVSIGTDGHVRKSRWMMLAWQDRYGTSVPVIKWAGRQYRVPDYLASRYKALELLEMLVWWAKLLVVVPESYTVNPIPTVEELVLQWKEFEKGNQ